MKRRTAQRVAVFVLFAAVSMVLSFQTDAAFADDIADLKAAVAALFSRVIALENKTSCMSAANKGLDVYFVGCNVHIVNGLADTETANGRGNLIIGYNEDATELVPPRNANVRTGSHNLVVGPYHTYSSYGGIVGGFFNSITGNYATVTGGRENLASASYSSVSGGKQNRASGKQASVTGGLNNLASGELASVTGGHDGKASGVQASVTGGSSNEANGFSATVSGGWRNTASGDSSSVSGGLDNKATAESSSVSGGLQNLAVGQFSSVGGGSVNTAGNSNKPNDASGGLYAVVSGGIGNSSAGNGAAIGGGQGVIAGEEGCWTAGGNNAVPAPGTFNAGC